MGLCLPGQPAVPEAALALELHSVGLRLGTQRGGGLPRLGQSVASIATPTATTSALRKAGRITTSWPCRGAAGPVFFGRAGTTGDFWTRPGAAAGAAARRAGGEAGTRGFAGGRGRRAGVAGWRGLHLGHRWRAEPGDGGGPTPADRWSLRSEIRPAGAGWARSPGAGADGSDCCCTPVVRRPGPAGRREAPGRRGHSRVRGRPAPPPPGARRASAAALDGRRDTARGRATAQPRRPSTGSSGEAAAGCAPPATPSGACGSEGARIDRS